MRADSAAARRPGASLKNQKEADQTAGTYHYKLWLPKGYNADPKKSWPSLFIMSAVGNADMGNMQSYLVAHGFIVVMLVKARTMMPSKIRTFSRDTALPCVNFAL